MVAGAESEPTQTPASRIVAEALVEGHDPSHIVDRAQKLGFTPCLTNAVVAACCGEHTSHADSPIQSDAYRETPSSD